MEKQPFYCTYFSYKGGVGRTSAMMNTALYLSRRKKRVLLIDFDLSAPGIDIFDVTDMELSKRLPSYRSEDIYAAAKSSGNLKKYSGDKFAPKGFVEICIKWQEENKIPEIRKPINIVNDWGKEMYVYQLPPHHLGDGEILMMRAGNYHEEEYYQQMEGIRDEHLDPGYLLPIEERSLTYPGDDEKIDARKRIAGIPPFVFQFKEEIQRSLKPDYVLIDCRPGDEPISNLAMTWFSDCVVLCFNLNPWNLEGIIRIYDKVLSAPGQRKRPNILLVASPIPRHAKQSVLYEGQYEKILEEMGSARNCGIGREGGSPIEVPYTEILSLRDVLISDIDESDPAVRSYEKLGQLIIARNSFDLENEIRAAKSEGDPEKIIQAFDRIIRDLQTDKKPLLYEYGKYLMTLGRYSQALLQLNEVWAQLKDLEKADEKYFESPYFQDTLHLVTKAKIALVRESLTIKRKFIPKDYNSEDLLKHKDELKRLRTALYDYVDKCNSIASELEIADIKALIGELCFYSAEVLYELNKKSKRGKEYNKNLKERRDLLEESKRNWVLAVKFKKDYAPFQYGLGAAQAHLTMMSEDNKIEGFKEAIQSFVEALKNSSDSPGTYIQLGIYLFSTGITAHVGDDCQPMPLFLEFQPFVEEIGRDNYWSDEEMELAIDLKELKTAEEKLTEAIQLSSHEFFAYFYRGLTRLFIAVEYCQTGITYNRDDSLPNELEKILKDANTDFDKTTLNEPLYSPAYFYNGLVQFFHNELVHKSLNDSSSDGGEGIKEILDRQAFYRLEHFINQELERILKLDTIRDPNRKEFYFKEEEVKIVQEDRFNFIRFLEMRMGFPPIVSILFPDKDLHAKKSFDEMMKSHFVIEKHAEENKEPAGDNKEPQNG